MEDLYISSTSEIFTRLDVSLVILSYFGTAKQCMQLMTRIRKQSNYLWKSNFQKWIKYLRKNKEEFDFISKNKSFKFMIKNHLYSYYKLKFDVNKLNDLINIVEFLVKVLEKLNSEGYTEIEEKLEDAAVKAKYPKIYNFGMIDISNISINCQISDSEVAKWMEQLQILNDILGVEFHSFGAISFLTQNGLNSLNGYEEINCKKFSELFTFIEGGFYYDQQIFIDKNCIPLRDVRDTVQNSCSSFSNYWKTLKESLNTSLIIPVSEKELCNLNLIYRNRTDASLTSFISYLTKNKHELKEVLLSQLCLEDSENVNAINVIPEYLYSSFSLQT